MGPSRHDPFGIGSDQGLSLGSKTSFFHLHPFRPKGANSLPSHLGIGVDTADHHFSNPGLQDGIDAGGRSFFGMAAGLQTDVKDRSPGLPFQFFQGIRLGVESAGTPMVTRRDNFSISNDDGAYSRIGRGAAPFLRQSQGLAHEERVKFGGFSGHFPLSLDL